MTHVTVLMRGSEKRWDAVRATSVLCEPSCRRQRGLTLYTLGRPIAMSRRMSMVLPEAEVLGPSCATGHLVSFSTPSRRGLSADRRLRNATSYYRAIAGAIVTVKSAVCGHRRWKQH
jgi:hypothetical protein